MALPEQDRLQPGPRQPALHLQDLDRGRHGGGALRRRRGAPGESFGIPTPVSAVMLQGSGPWRPKTPGPSPAFRRRHGVKKGYFLRFLRTWSMRTDPSPWRWWAGWRRDCSAAPEDVVAFGGSGSGALSARCCGVISAPGTTSPWRASRAVERFGSPEDPRALTDRMVEHWCAPPLYETPGLSGGGPRPGVSGHQQRRPLCGGGPPARPPRGRRCHQPAARYAKPRPEIPLRPGAVWPSSGDRPPGGLAGRGCGDAPRSGYPGPLAQPEGKPVPPGVEAAENLAEAARTLAPLF